MSVAIIPSPERVENQIWLATRQPRWTRQWVGRIRDFRYRARHDLLWLCNHVVGFPDINQKVHGSMIDLLQKFPLPPAAEREDYDQFHGFHPVYERPIWVYKPYKKMTELEGKRRRMLLHARASMKTSVNTIAHSVQWIINYPEVIILLVQSTDDKSSENLNGILKIWRAQLTFRELFPEHVPWISPFAFGTKSRMRTMCAPMDTVTKESYTVKATSILKGEAGGRAHVIKFSDIVDEKNSKTSSGLEMVWQKMNYYIPLLVTPEYWIDVEGTRYHHLDAYGKIWESQRDLPEEEREWLFHAKGCYVKKRRDGKPLQGTLDELDEPDLLDENGNRVSYWPERFPVEVLERIRKRDEALFACQYRNNPTDIGDPSLITFHPNKFLVIPKEAFLKNVRVAFHITTADTANTVTNTSDFSVITTCAWDRSGKCYVVDIRHGRWHVDQFVEELFEVYRAYKPIKVIVERQGWAFGLEASVKRRVHLDVANGNKRYPELPVEVVPRESRERKHERILLSLQQPYNRGEIIFLESLSCLEMAKKEFLMFPRYHDDILDTLSDQFQLRSWFGRLLEDTPEQKFLSAVEEFNLRQQLIAEKFASGQVQMPEGFAFFEGMEKAAAKGNDGNPLPPIFQRTGGL